MAGGIIVNLKIKEGGAEVALPLDGLHTTFLWRKLVRSTGKIKIPSPAYNLLELFRVGTAVNDSEPSIADWAIKFNTDAIVV